MQHTPGNQRRYARAVLRRVAVIKVAQRMGVPLAEIAEALQELPSGRTPTQADWSALSARWRHALFTPKRRLFIESAAPARPWPGNRRHCAAGRP